MKERYDILCQSFPQLPSFEALMADFEVGADDSEMFPLRRIVVQMGEQVSLFKGLIQPAVEPDPSSVMGMFEHAALTRSELDGAFALFKQLCIMRRQLDVARVSGSAVEQAEVIRCVFEQWKETKSQIHSFLKVLEQAWINERPPVNQGPSYLQ